MKQSIVRILTPTPLLPIQQPPIDEPLQEIAMSEELPQAEPEPMDIVEPASMKFFSKKGRGQRAEGRRDLSLLMNVRTLWATKGSQGFKPPTKISDLVARNQCGSEAHTVLHPSALCLLPSAFFTIDSSGWRVSDILREIRLDNFDLGGSD